MQSTQIVKKLEATQIIAGREAIFNRRSKNSPEALDHQRFAGKTTKAEPAAPKHDTILYKA